jgi:hypothetical protein
MAVKTDCLAYFWSIIELVKNDAQKTTIFRLAGYYLLLIYYSGFSRNCCFFLGRMTHLWPSASAEELYTNASRFSS